MRAIALVLGAVAPLVLLGCVGAETETEAADEVAENVGEDAALATGTGPVPHGRFQFAFVICKVGTVRTPCLVWPPPIQVVAQ